jgi:hypothetical protein
MPPRLWLELELERRNAAGALTHGGWVIRDGPKKVSTGCSAADHIGAAKALERYRTALYATTPLPKNKTAAEVLISDVLRHYMDAKNGDLAGGTVVAVRFGHFLKF